MCGSDFSPHGSQPGPMPPELSCGELEEPPQLLSQKTKLRSREVLIQGQNQCLRTNMATYKLKCVSDCLSIQSLDTLSYEFRCSDHGCWAAWRGDTDAECLGSNCAPHWETPSLTLVPSMLLAVSVCGQNSHCSTSLQLGILAGGAHSFLMPRKHFLLGRDPQW